MVTDVETDAGEHNDERLLRLFICDNPDPYIRVLSAARQHFFRALELNLAAMIAPVVWCFYRRMYEYGAFFLFVMLVIALLPPAIGKPLTIGIAIGFGMTANLLYVRFASAQVTELKGIPLLTPEHRDELIRRAGGTSLTGALIGLILYISLVSYLVVIR